MGAGIGVKSREEARRELAEQLRALATLVDEDEIETLSFDYRLKKGGRFSYRRTALMSVGSEADCG